MRSEVKRSTYAAVQEAVKSASAAVVLEKQRQGYWSRATGDCISVELEVLFEDAHGEGMFRLGWGVRVAGVAKVLGLSDLPGIVNATIGGDLGSLVRRRRGMTMLCLKSAGAGSLARLWWGTRGQSPDELTEVMRAWLVTVGPQLAALSSHHEVAGFVRAFPSNYGKADVHPDSDIGRLQTEIGIYAVARDPTAVDDALTRWRFLTESDRRDPFLHQLDDEFEQRVLVVLC